MDKETEGHLGQVSSLGQARPGQGQAGQARPRPARPGQPGQAKARPARPGRPGQARPVRPGQARPAQETKMGAMGQCKNAEKPCLLSGYVSYKSISFNRVGCNEDWKMSRAKLKQSDFHQQLKEMELAANLSQLSKYVNMLVKE